MLAWLTKNNIPSGRVSFVVTLPDDETWRADFLGAFFLLTQPQNWELDQGLTPDEMSDEWADIFNDFVESGGDALLEDVTAETLRLTATGEATLSSTVHPFQIGPTSGANMIIDPDEIQARNNGAIATFNINPHGGAVVASIFRASSSSSAALSTSNQAIMAGVSNLANVIIDTVSIQARNNGAIATLNLNPLGGTVKVNQPSTTAAVPPLHLKQADLSEELIRFESTVASGNPINTTGLGAYYGRVRVYIEGVGAKWLALYD